MLERFDTQPVFRLPTLRLLRLATHHHHSVHVPRGSSAGSLWFSHSFMNTAGAQYPHISVFNSYFYLPAPILLFSHNYSLRTYDVLALDHKRWRKTHPWPRGSHGPTNEAFTVQAVGTTEHAMEGDRRDCIWTMCWQKASWRGWH